MELSVRINLKKAALSLAAFLFFHAAFAQAVPELVFRNPVLEQGVAGQNNAVYRFSAITDGVDGLLKIKKRSDSTVVLSDIDLYRDPVTAINYGWDKALQPRLGRTGNVPANQNWWMQFELKFVKPGTTDRKKIKDFVVTSLDIDGDNVSIREYVQMDKIKSLAYSPVTYLKTGTAIASSLLSQIEGDGSDSYNLAGTDNMILGPVSNFTDIDTAATAVMATYTYEDKDAITFVIGGTSGAAISNAGVRLNSLWFKSFSLAPQFSTLPLKLETFSTTYTDKAVVLNWKTTSEKDFSHFVIERSVDGKSYSDVAMVFSAGGLQENMYSYKDKAVKMPAGVAYYRLRMVDEDRTFSYSFVSAVHLSKNGKTTAIAVYPNPAKSSVSVSLPDAWQGKAISLKIYNSTGAVKTSKEIRRASAMTDVAINDLPTGIYIVEAACNGEAAQKMILKN